jgi:hypothetical protein
MLAGYSATRMPLSRQASGSKFKEAGSRRFKVQCSKFKVKIDRRASKFEMFNAFKEVRSFVADSRR